MNPNYYSHKFNHNKYDDSDEDDDNEYYMNDESEDMDDSDEVLKMYGQQPNKKYGSSYQKGGGMSSTTGFSAGAGKYDVNNPGYRISSVNMANEKGGSKYSSMLDSGKGMSSSAGLYSGANQKKSGYDPYSNINIGGYNLGAYDTFNMNQYNIGGYSNNKDKYNIDIDLDKIKKETETPAATNVKNFLNTEIAKKNEDNITTGVKKKKNVDFFDDLDRQLEKEKKQEEEAAKVLEEDSVVDSEEDNYDYNQDKTDKYTNIDYLHDNSEDKDNDSLINKFENEKKTEVENKPSNADSNIHTKEIENQESVKDSTISIDKFLNDNHPEEKIETENSKHDLDEENFSYNKFTTSRDIRSKEKNKEEVYNPDRMEEYLKKTGGMMISEDKNGVEEKEKPVPTLNSDADQKYNDFEDNSKLYGQQSENDADDVYAKFDGDVASNLAESNNDSNRLYKLAQSSASKNDIKNLMLSSSVEVNSGRVEENNKIKEIMNEIRNNHVTGKEEDRTSDKKEELDKVPSIVDVPANNIDKSQVKPSTGNKSFEINYNQEYIQNIIAEEFKKVMSMHNNFSVMSSVDPSTPNPNNLRIFSQNPTNINFAKDEVQHRLKSYIIDNSQNFLIYSDSHNKLKGFDKKKVIPYNNIDLFISRTVAPKKDIREMKLQIALDEERKRREYFELHHNRFKELNDELEVKVKRMKRIELENSELQKQVFETEQIYKELEVDLLSLKTDYEVKLKLVEERVSLRESKSEARKLAEMQRNYEIEIDNLKMELNERTNECLEYKAKYEFFEKENTKLSINKISNLETNDKIKELRNENFVLHEKCNELTIKFERLYAEKEKLEKKLIEKAAEEEDQELDNKNERVSKNNASNKNESKNLLILNEKLNSLMTTGNNFVNNIGSSEAQFSLFDQIMLEREQSVQESIIKSYSKEIEKLSNDVKLLKNIAGGDKTNKIQIKQNHYHSTGDNNHMRKTSNPRDTQFNNYLNFNANNSKGFNTHNESNIFKDSAEEKIKLLSKILNDPTSAKLSPPLCLNTVENEFSIYEKLINSLPEETATSGEIDIDSFLKILLIKLKVPLSKYELIEIYNNFPRTSNNKIRYNDFLNALRSKSPSNFFIQPDPSYMKDIEAKIISYENRIKEFDKLQEGFKSKESELKNKISSLENEIISLSSKIRSYQERESSNENLLGSLVKNNFFGGNINNNKVDIKEDPTIKKLKEKIKQLENTNLNNLAEFEKKISLYEDKFNNIKKNFDNGETSDRMEITKLNKELTNFKEENLILKGKLHELEINSKNESLKYQEKLNKYKKNYQTLKEKLEKSEKDKQKIISSLQGKNKNLDLNPNIIQNFIINTEEIEELTKKLNELEKKNKEREENYRQICYNSNTYQVNKEIEALNKKFEIERKEYLKIINQKSNDIMVIKKEFEEIYRELEEIKFSKKIR